MKARIVLPARILPTLALLALSACVAPVGPVEVTRFHVPDVQLGRGPIAVVPAAGMSDTGLELRTYQSAVARELVRVGYAETAAAGAQVAEVRMMRRTWQPGRERGPVSVGLGAGGGSYGGGV